MKGRSSAFSQGVWNFRHACNVASDNVCWDFNLEMSCILINQFQTKKFPFPKKIILGTVTATFCISSNSFSIEQHLYDITDYGVGQTLLYEIELNIHLVNAHLYRRILGHDIFQT